MTSAFEYGSPLPARLVTTRTWPGHPGDIYVMRPDGSDVRMLTDDTFEKATLGFLR